MKKRLTALLLAAALAFAIGVNAVSPEDAATTPAPAQTDAAEPADTVETAAEPADTAAEPAETGPAFSKHISTDNYTTVQV